MAGKGFNHTPNTGEFRNAGSPGIRSTGAYLIGARPFILRAALGGGANAAGQVHTISFPFITRLITVINQDAAGDDCIVSFGATADAFDHHGISLNNNRDSMTFNVRSNKIYIKTAQNVTVNVEIFAELTDIPSARFGDGWTGKGINTDYDDAAVKQLEIVTANL